MSLSQLDMSSAACARVEDSTLFHQPSKVEKAKAICAGCPILDACREASLELEKCWGVRSRGGSVQGGMTPEERYAEDRRRWPELPVRRGLDVDQRKALAS